MSRILVIDDMRIFPFECIYARSLAEGFGLIETAQFGDELWLDHDLGGFDTIRPIVDKIEEAGFFADGDMTKTPYTFRRIVTVTDNPVGEKYIFAALSKYYPIDRYTGECSWLMY